jgi:hypothetical protein
LPKSRHFRQACAVCGQVFTAHFEVDVEAAPMRTRIPCLADGCSGQVVVAHPRSAYALWLEEF